MSCFCFKVPVEDEQPEVIRELRDLPPLHYLFKIQNFSQLSNARAVNFESSDFEVGGYQWRLRLCLYQNGKNKLMKEKGHLSLSLILPKSNSLPLEKEVYVNFKLFAYNQIQDKYMAVQDAKERIRRFSAMKTEWGFDQLLPLNVFNDPSNGYLIKDSCTFGAEVFVFNPKCNPRKGESASVVMELGDNTFTWCIQNFEKMKEESYKSEVFTIGGHKWSLVIFPNGYRKNATAGPFRNAGKLSAYLRLEDSEVLHPENKLNVENTGVVFIYSIYMPRLENLFRKVN